VSKQQTTAIPATTVISWTAIPHSNQNVQSPNLLKAISIHYGTVRGWQTNPYKHVSYLISKQWCKHCNIYIKPNKFQTTHFITRDFFRFSFRFLLCPLQKTNIKVRKPLIINQTVWNKSGPCTKTTRNKAVVSDSQQCLSIQEYNNMSWLIQKFHILMSVLFLL